MRSSVAQGCRGKDKVEPISRFPGSCPGQDQDGSAVGVTGKGSDVLPSRPSCGFFPRRDSRESEWREEGKMVGSIHGNAGVLSYEK